MDNKSFGETIKLARKAKGLTQEALAEIVDIDEKHLSRIENGKSFPSIHTLNNLLIALNLTYSVVGLGAEISKFEGNQTYMRALQILNSAENNIQLECYLDALTTTQRLFKMLAN